MEIKHHHFDQLDSTQTHLLGLLDQALEPAHPLLITTSQQLAGFGRRGHTWSHKPNSIAMSFTLQPHPVVTLSTLDLAIAVAEYFKFKQDIELSIKWPNDLFQNGAKVGGIIAHTHHSKQLVMGLGLNLGPNDELFEYKSVPYIGNSQKLAYQLYEFILKRPQLTVAQIQEKFLYYCHHLGQNCQFENKQYIFKSIGDDGQAILEDKVGKTLEVYSGSLLFH